MTEVSHSTVPSLAIAWAKGLAESWALASPERKKQLREKYRGAEEFWEILEAINAMPNSEPTFGLALTVQEIWRNRLNGGDSDFLKTTR